METIAKLFKIDMKIFHNYKGQDKIISIHLMVSQKN